MTETKNNEGVVSSRAANPLSLTESVNDVFCDRRQAKATTATRLFRSEEMFCSIREKVMPNHFENFPERSVSIWSAGCSSGAETYSIAMIALEEFVKKRKHEAVRVFGTDINRERLAEGKSGAYLAPNPVFLKGKGYDKILEKYSEKRGAYIHMSAKLKMHVKFGLFDMRKRPKKHTFDFIVCDHVLQYYDHDGQLHILRNLKSVLRPGGYLYLEGITPKIPEHGNIEKVPGYKNLYQPT